MMKTFFGASALAMFIAMALPASAQDSTSGSPEVAQTADRGNGAGHRDGHGGHHGRGKHGGRHMLMIDANGDGVIGDDEAATIADHAFNRIDRDGSGDVVVDEFSTVRGRHGWRNWFGSGAQNEAMVEGLKAKFAQLDADKDGKLTKAEFLADAKVRFASADTDKDGKVSPWEFRAQN
jgi:EF hand